jgi:hypothetical protein
MMELSEKPGEKGLPCQAPDSLVKMWGRDLDLTVEPWSDRAAGSR